MKNPFDADHFDDDTRDGAQPGNEAQPGNDAPPSSSAPESQYENQQVSGAPLHDTESFEAPSSGAQSSEPRTPEAPPTPAYPAQMTTSPDSGQPFPAAPHAGQPYPRQPYSGQPQPLPQSQPQPQPQNAYLPYEPQSQPPLPAEEPQLPAQEPQLPAEEPPLPSGNHDGQPRSSRAGALVAGLLIGGLLGGVAGGAAAAVIAANTGGALVGSVAGSGGTITLESDGSKSVVSGIAKARTPSVVTLEVSNPTGQGSGSGVIIREDGYILTNAHVLTLDSGSTKDAVVRVRMSDGRLLPGEVIGTDPFADLAVVKVAETGLPIIGFADSSEIEVGDLTVAIGAPLDLPSTVTTGVVSAVNRGISVGSAQLQPDDSQDPEAPNFESPFRFPWEQRPGQGAPDPNSAPPVVSQVTLPVIQTDASINPGNSGGALLNDKGDLIGINVAIASTSSPEAAGSVGLGFAIPANLAKRVADDLIAGNVPTHGLLGAGVGDASSVVDASHAGGLITEVQPDSAAEKAGLRAGDVITSVGGISAADGTSVSALVRMHEAGEDVAIVYSRDGQQRETVATLGSLQP